MRYDHQNRAVREYTQNNITGVASTTITKFHVYAAGTLKRVSALIATAGTNASAGVDIYVGTTSVGAITVGTSLAGVAADSGVIDVAIPAAGMIDIRGKANSATMVLSFCAVVEPTVAADVD